MFYLPADYIQLEKCTLLNYTTYWVTIEYVIASVYCISRSVFSQDAIHHLAHIDNSTSASCRRGLLWYVLFSTNFSIFNIHTSTDFESIFTDHVTQCILSVLEFIALFGMGGRPYIKLRLSVCDLQLCHGKRGTHVIFYFSPISH